MCRMEKLIETAQQLTQKKHISPIVWWVIVIFHLIVTYGLTSNHQYIPDESGFRELAINIATRGSYHTDGPCFFHPAGSPNTYHAPGWPGLLAMGFYVTKSEWSFWVILGLVWALNSYLIYLLGSVLKLAPAGSWLLVIWLTLNPLYLYYHGHLMTESLTISFCLALSILGIKFISYQRPKELLLLAIVSAAAHLVRTQLLTPIIAIWVVAMFSVPFPKMLRYFFIFALIHLALISPWLWRMNQVQGGFTSVELKAGWNLYHYSGSKTDAYSPEGAGKNDAPDGVELLTPKERNAKFLGLAITEITQNPATYLEVCLRRLGFLLSPVPNFTEASALKRLVIALSNFLFFYLFGGLIVWQAVYKKRITREQYILLSCLILWYVFHVLINASIRLRLPSDVWCAALAISMWGPKMAGEKQEG